MDPNEALRMARQALDESAQHMAAGRVPAGATWAARAAEYYEALDEWLSKGGFLPDEWATRRDVVTVADYDQARADQARADAFNAATPAWITPATNRD